MVKKGFLSKRAREAGYGFASVAIPCATYAAVYPAVITTHVFLPEQPYAPILAVLGTGIIGAVATIKAYKTAGQQARLSEAYDRGQSAGMGVNLAAAFAGLLYLNTLDHSATDIDTSPNNQQNIQQPALIAD